MAKHPTTVVTLLKPVPAGLLDAVGLASAGNTGDVLNLDSEAAVALVRAGVARYGSATTDPPAVAAPTDAAGGGGLTIAATTTTAGALVAGKHNPVDASGGAKAMTLPTGTSGKLLSVEKVDASTNAVTVSGNVRGVGGATISLVWQNEDLLLASDAAGSWWPVAGHKTKASLDAAYAGQVTDAAVATRVTSGTATTAALKAAYVTALAAPTGVAATDTATIQGAIDAAATAGGGRVLLRAGTYVVSKLTIKTGVHLAGQGRTSTVVQLAAGVNDNVIESQNFATLTGTDTSATPCNFGITDLTIDGNKAAQTTGTSHGLALYAYGYRLDAITIRNCRSNGIWSEWGSASPFLAPDGMEAFVTNYKIHDCDAGGVTHQGPHDSQWINGFIVKNSGTVGGTYGLNIPQDGRSNGSVFTNLHVYGGGYDYGLRNASSGLEFLGCQFEGAQLGQTLILASLNKMSECKWFAGGVAGTTVKAIVVGDATHTNINGLRLTGKVENTQGAVLDMTYSGGDHRIDLHAQFTGSATITTPIIGGIDKNSNVNVHVVKNDGTTHAGSAAQFPAPLYSTNTVHSYFAAARVAGECFPRALATSNRGLTSGVLLAMCFTPDDTITVSNLSMVQSGTLAAGLTLGRLALFTSDGGSGLTCIARTASDTTLFTAAGVNTRAIADNGAATPGAIGSVTLQRGTRYALGVLVVGTTMPQIIGAAAFPAVTAFGPSLGIQYAGQTDVSATYTGAGYSGAGSLLWGYAS